MNIYDDFIKRMYMAFFEAEKPTLKEMTPHRCPECDDIRDELHKYNMEDIPDNVLNSHGGSLPLMSPKALHYYLPRYIEFGLLNQDSDAYEFTLYHLAPDKIDDYYITRLALFTSDEKSIIREYLELRKTMEYAEFDEEEITKGLELWV